MISVQTVSSIPVFPRRDTSPSRATPDFQCSLRVPQKTRPPVRLMVFSIHLNGSVVIGMRSPVTHYSLQILGVRDGHERRSTGAFLLLTLPDVL